MMNETILLRYFSGESTEAEKQAVHLWLEESEDNRKLAEDIYYLYYASETLHSIRSTNTPEALRKVKKKIHSPQRVPVIVWLQRVAAILFIPVLLVSGYLHFRPEEVRYMETSTAPGMVSAVELPDGSKVWLNAGSSLRYPVTFNGKSREVHLDGEAFFSVQKDKMKRFLVHTPHQLNVEVLGTEFNMDAYSSSEFITTTLVEGSIRLTYVIKGKEEQLIMQPDQKVVYSTAGQILSQSTANSQQETAWKDGRILLRDTPLKELLWILNKRFHVEFDIENPSLAEDSFTGTFDDQDLIMIMEHLKISSNIQYRIERPAPKTAAAPQRPKVILY